MALTSLWLTSVFDLYTGVGLQLPRILLLLGSTYEGGGQRSLIAEITFKC